ncbi:MAG: hypothetical protein AB8G05_21315 [Oligoflexales bacterium]
MKKIFFFIALFVGETVLGLNIDEKEILNKWEFEINYDLEFIYEDADRLGEKTYVDGLISDFFSQVTNGNFDYFKLIITKQKILSHLNSKQFIVEYYSNDLRDIEANFGNYFQLLKTQLLEKYQLIDGIDMEVFAYLNDELPRIVEYMDTNGVEDESLDSAMESLKALMFEMSNQGLSGYFDFIEIFWKTLESVEAKDIEIKEFAKKDRNKLFKNLRNYFYSFEKFYINPKNSLIFLPIE